MTALRSLILGLRLRGNICASERELLDSLAPPGWITFLASKHGWVHPQRTELFDLDKLQCTSHHGGGAIFSQQCRAGRTGDRCWRILSAVVADDQHAPLILGWCGPESDAAADRMLPAYSSLVRQARSAWMELNDLVGELSTGLARGEPMLVINRGSGRVLAANEAAARALNSTRQQLTDTESTALPSAGQRRWPGGRVSMQNLDAAGLSLTVLTLDTTEVAGREDTFVADFFTRRVRHKISNLLTAATLLESMIAENEDRSESVLVRNIVSEAESLNEYIRKATILIDYDGLETTRVSLVTALEESTDLVESALSCRGSIDIAENGDDPGMRAPHSAAVALFEAILRSHLVDRTAHPSATVAICRPPDSAGHCIRFETQLGPGCDRVAADRGWLDYADRLAARMGFADLHSSDDGATLRTVLTLGPEPQRGGNHV